MVADDATMRRCGGEVNLLWAGIVGRRGRVLDIVQRLGLRVGGERGFSRLSGGLSRLLVSLSSARILEFGDGVAMDSISVVSQACEIVAGGRAGGIEEKKDVTEFGSKKQQEPGKCQLWIPKKRRFCASHALPGLQFVAITRLWRRRPGFRVLSIHHTLFCRKMLQTM